MMTRIKISSKFKTLRQRRLPAGRQGSSFGGKAQNYNLKVKSNVIASPEASGGAKQSQR